MKLSEAEQLLRNGLNGIYSEGEVDAVARLAIEHVTGWASVERMGRKSETLSARAVEDLQSIMARLKQHEPIQYIINKSWFYGMELYVDRNVLVPRPETEELVDWIVKTIRASGKDVFSRAATDSDETTTLKILDVGTGSGCIALALKKTMPRAEVWGCDISDEALNVARRNGSALDIRVDFQAVNFLDEGQQKQLPTVDLIVSNPPYVPQRDKATMDPNVVNYEPHSALFVPDEDALKFYRALIRFSSHRLYPAGSIFAEIHESLGFKVVNLFGEAGFEVELRKDMQGKDRMVHAVRKKPS
ncbi:MAG TPA: peptide chain release factor N(5)-glutamine methyltransferase [Flavisolibacter sp.]|nr:peptide chain release factor N(5)-glutamine methyltransferase [Flavisolibacter sp.]